MSFINTVDYVKRELECSIQTKQELLDLYLFLLDEFYELRCTDNAVEFGATMSDVSVLLSMIAIKLTKDKQE